MKYSSWSMFIYLWFNHHLLSPWHRIERNGQSFISLATIHQMLHTLLWFILGETNILEVFPLNIWIYETSQKRQHSRQFNYSTVLVIRWILVVAFPNLNQIWRYTIMDTWRKGRLSMCVLACGSNHMIENLCTKKGVFHVDSKSKLTQNQKHSQIPVFYLD